MSGTIAEAVAAFAHAMSPGARVVDVGCGLQPYRPYFSGMQCIGIDVRASGRTEHQKTADVYFDGTRIPIETASIDGVLCTQVLEHAVDPDALVAEIFRVLRPGGRLCITVPFMWGLHELPYDFRRFTPFGLERLVSGSGFVIDRQEKIADGARAIRMLIDSEVNNYLVNVRPGEKRGGWAVFRLRVAVRLHERLLRLLERVWRAEFRFERVYIDNLLLAHKP